MNPIYLIFHRTIINSNNVATTVSTMFPEKYFLTLQDAENYLLENGWSKNTNYIIGDHYLSHGRIAIIKEVSVYE